MWTSDLVATSAILRQGDLLIGFSSPKLILPFHYARPEGASVASGQPALLQTKTPAYLLVVSQCCTIEQHKSVALAPVRSTKALSADELAAYEVEEPSDDPNAQYAFNVHPLAPFGDHLQRTQGRIQVADLLGIQTYSGDTSSLQQLRIASMSPAGRRLLRIRLSLFWGRVEAEDEQWFVDQGLPAGARSASPENEAPTEDAAASPPVEAEESVGEDVSAGEDSSHTV